MPFLYQGQYYDKETELAYNRFRYYDPNTGSYISQDPIRLAGNNPTLYGYVFDNNVEVDVFGLRKLEVSEIKALDDHLSTMGVKDANKGIYNFMNTDDLNYTGSAGTGQGTNTIRDRLLQHMRNDHLKVEDINTLKIINMNNATDSEVWMKEATIIKNNGGIGDENVANKRRPRGTVCIAKK